MNQYVVKGTGSYDFAGSIVEAIHEEQARHRGTVGILNALGVDPQDRPNYQQQYRAIKAGVTVDLVTNIEAGDGRE